MSAEKQSVIESLAAETGVPLHEVERVVPACHDVVDELVGDDYSVIAPPLVLARTDDPCFLALKARLQTCTDEEAQECLTWEHDKLAAWLELSEADLARNPIANLDRVLAELLDRLGLPPEEPSTWPSTTLAYAERVVSVLDAWIDSFADQRRYVVGPVGLEQNFESWLVANLEVLAERDFPVQLAERGRQRRLDGGRLRPDLLCRFTQDTGGFRTDDWLVVENKAGAAYAEAADQVLTYVERVREELARPDERVFGLLIANGASHDVQSHLDALGVGYVSMASLGYLRRDWKPATFDPDASHALATRSPLGRAR